VRVELEEITDPTVNNVLDMGFVARRCCSAYRPYDYPVSS
jgi:hypothetical protein